MVDRARVSASDPDEKWLQARITLVESPSDDVSGRQPSPLTFDLRVTKNGRGELRREPNNPVDSAQPLLHFTLEPAVLAWLREITGIHRARDATLQSDAKGDLEAPLSALEPDELDGLHAEPAAAPSRGAASTTLRRDRRRRGRGLRATALVALLILAGWAGWHRLRGESIPGYQAAVNWAASVMSQVAPRPARHTADQSLSR